MQILPKVRTRFGENVGAEIFVQPPYLQDNETTYITTDASSGVSSFSVDNGLKFSVGEYIVIGNIGAEKTEIVRIHASTTPTATTITLASTTNFAHNKGERIVFIPYNQVVIQRSTDSGSSYSDLATIDLRVDTTEIYYQHTSGASTDYYRAKFKNSASAGESAVSDGIIATGFVANSAGAIIREALVSLGERIDGKMLTKELLYSFLNEGRHEIDRHVMVERWSFRTVFDYDAGNVIPGQYQLTLPTDIRDEDTFKNVLSLRIGKDKLPLTKQDQRSIESWYRGVARTTVATTFTDAATSIVLTSSGDFDDSGSIDVAASTVSGTIDNIAYTGNTLSSSTLTGVTLIATGGHSSGVNVWQGAGFGLPQEYTVDNGVVTFSQPFGNNYAGENIWMSYYKKITDMDSDGDTFDEPFYKIYLPYLRYRIKARKNQQFQRDTDDDYKSWVEKRESQVKKEFTGQAKRVHVDVPGLRRFYG